MQCLKCGRQIADKQAFCDDCLQIMQDYPVKPGTVIQLPTRQSETEERKQQVRRRAPSQSEQLAQLRVKVRRQRWVIFALTLILVAIAAIAVWLAVKQPQIVDAGKNYLFSE